MRVLAGAVVGALLTLVVVVWLREPAKRPRYAIGDRDVAVTAAARPLFVPVPVAAPARPAAGDERGAPAAAPASVLPPRQPLPSNPEDERKMFVEGVRRGGRSNEPWTRTASDLFRATEGNLAKGLEGKVQWSAVECYQAGCVATASCSDGLAYEALDESLRVGSSSPLVGWTGIQYRSPPARLESGAVQASWVLFRPGFDPGELQQ